MSHFCLFKQPRSRFRKTLLATTHLNPSTVSGVLKLALRLKWWTHHVQASVGRSYSACFDYFWFSIRFNDEIKKYAAGNIARRNSNKHRAMPICTVTCANMILPIWALHMDCNCMCEYWSNYIRCFNKYPEQWILSHHRRRTRSNTNVDAGGCE